MAHDGCVGQINWKGRLMPVSQGERFGRLVALQRVRRDKTTWWECVCDCGTVKWTRHGQLQSGRTTSCGCFQREHIAKAATTHGGSKTLTWRSWVLMRERCSNSRSKKWKHYGGRGIAVCGRWSNFSNFLADMGERPPGMTLDRIDVNGNYEPSNCRWADHKQQMRNTRNTVMITALGKTRSMIEWSEETGIKIGTIWARLNVNKWSPERALTEKTHG